jgi:outer membrane protein assembly factor BamB
VADKWPESGPKQLWSRDLGDGYATVSVDGDRLYTMYRADDKEHAICLNARTGETVWEHGYEAPVTEGMIEFGAGPHATPLIVGDRVFTVGIASKLHCFDKKSGDVMWSHDLKEEFGGEIPMRGYSISPIAFRDTVILPVGGKPDQGAMAFSQADGSVEWSKQHFGVAHASPILLSHGGRDQLIFFGTIDIRSLDPKTGEQFWSHPHKTQFGANLSTPVWNGDDVLFCSAAYDSGSRALRLKFESGEHTTEELWYGRKLRLHHAQPIIIDGHVYGSSGDFGPAFITCLELQTGKLKWRERGFTKANLIHGDGKLIILDEDGQLALARVSPEKFELLSTCDVANRYAWAAPTLVGSTLYVRDRETIKALNVGPQSLE